MELPYKKDEKPVHPHYSRSRRFLQEALTRTESDITDAESSLKYNQNQVVQLNESIERMKAQTVHIKIAMGALSALDKSGVVMKAVGDAA